MQYYNCDPAINNLVHSPNMANISLTDISSQGSTFTISNVMHLTIKVKFLRFNFATSTGCNEESKISFLGLLIV